MLTCRDVVTIIKETGIKWIVCRSIYFAKIKLLSVIPKLDILFEKKVNVKKINAFEFDVNKVESCLHQLSKEQKKYIINKADKALLGRIDAFSSVEFDYGYPIQWDLNPLSNKKYDMKKKWFLIPDFSEEMGDIKANWEISRFSHLWYLLRAYMLTKNDKYYLGFCNQIKDWLHKNLYSYGPNFKCGQECTLRMMNVLAVENAFEEYGLVTQDVKKNVKKMVEVNYKKVLSNFFYAHHCIKVDHLIAELCGQILGAWCSDENEKVCKYFEMLENEIIEQFNELGLYYSYSLNYQRYVLQLIEFMLLLANKSCYEFSDKCKQRIYYAAELYFRLFESKGKIPNYGANDGTWIFPISSGGYTDYRSTANAILFLLDGKIRFDSVDVMEEALWVGGKKKAERNSVQYSNISKKLGILKISANNFDVFMNAHEYERRPGHFDQLHVDIWYKGECFFCDTGTYSYADRIGDGLKITSGHNTIKPRGMEQMKSLGKFLVYGKPKILNYVVSDDAIMCEQKFYTGYTHKRNICKKGDTIEINDYVVSNNGMDEYEVFFHTPCKVIEVTKQECLLRSETGDIIKITSDSGQVSIEDAYVSEKYLELKKINCIKIFCNNKFHRTNIEVM